MFGVLLFLSVNQLGGVQILSAIVCLAVTRCMLCAENNLVEAVNFHSAKILTQSHTTG